MNDRQRFHATMHYQPRDRCPILDFGFWDETYDAWYEQGLPPDIHKENIHDYFGMDFDLEGPLQSTGVSVGLMPAFERMVLQDLGDREIVQQEDGVQVLRSKTEAAIPQPTQHLLIDRESWQKYYKPRLDPGNSTRFPADWDEQVKIWADPGRDYPIFLPGGSLYGWLRNWMGMENLSLVLYDDPAWFEEMVATLADCTISVLGRILNTGGRFEACAMWEDMCYSAGPLLSPRHFKKYLVPHYRRIADLLHKHDHDVIWLDSDGNIDKLLPLWLDAGVNCLFPIEVGTWGADPIKYRQHFGRDLLMMGGISKHILAGTKAGIEAEVYRLLPLVEDGGFIPYCDHRVPPDVLLENYLFYLTTARRILGMDLNLRPILDKGM